MRDAAGASPFATSVVSAGRASLTETAILAVIVAAAAGLLAGRAWSAAARRENRARLAFRGAPHYQLGLHALAEGRTDKAIAELSKLATEDSGAIEVQLILGNLLREAGLVERAIQVHQALLRRDDLSRSEHRYALACLGSDFRKAGFLDRATETFEEVLQSDPRDLQALEELERLFEDQRRFTDAFAAQTRLSRLRKSDDGLVLGHLQAEVGREALAQGRIKDAETAFRAALDLHRRVFPAHLGLADIAMRTDSRRAVSILEEATLLMPERAYLAFSRFVEGYRATGEPQRFEELCERLIAREPRDWRARLALAQHLGAAGRDEEAYGLLLRALESNPRALPVQVELLSTLRRLGVRSEKLDAVLAAMRSSFYKDPHLCSSCRYRADDMLWRCPQCHRWATFVEDRIAGGD